MNEPEEVTDQALREARSFPRLHSDLTQIGDLITNLWRHVRAASHIVGIPEPGGLKPAPRTIKGPVAPMIRVFEDLHDFRDWLMKVDDALEAPLQELVPEFYEDMAQELKKTEPQ